LSKILASNGLAQNQIEWADKASNYLTSNITHKKSQAKTNNFFVIADLKTCQVFWGFEQISSAIGLGVIQLRRHMKTASFRLKDTGSEGINSLTAQNQQRWIWMWNKFIKAWNCGEHSAL